MDAEKKIVRRAQYGTSGHVVVHYEPPNTSARIYRYVLCTAQTSLLSDTAAGHIAITDWSTQPYIKKQAHQPVACDGPQPLVELREGAHNAWLLCSERLH